jgi:hypothetical protein
MNSSVSAIWAIWAAQGSKEKKIVTFEGGFRQQIFFIFCLNIVVSTLKSCLI